MNKTVLDSGFYAVDSEYRYWIPAPFSEELRFRIPTSCSQFTNWGVKKLIASCFTEIFFLFFFWKLRHRITADSNDCFPLAGTHFPTGNSGVVYIFLRVVGALLHRNSFRCYCISAVRSEWRCENWKIQQNFCAQPRHASLSLCGGDRTVGMGSENNSRRARYLWDLSLPHVTAKAETCIFYWLVFPWIGRNNFNLLLFA